MRDRANIRKAIAHARYVSRAQRTDRRRNMRSRSAETKKAHNAHEPMKPATNTRLSLTVGSFTPIAPRALPIADQYATFCALVSDSRMPERRACWRSISLAVV